MARRTTPLDHARHAQTGDRTSLVSGRRARAPSSRVQEQATRGLEGPGSALPQPVRGDFERRYGLDFAGVRVHIDQPAAQAAQGLRADAFTLGKHIGFARGRFAPDTSRGQRLLAHELAHVVQQSHSTNSTHGAALGGLGVAAEASPDAESEAERVAEAVVHGRAPPPIRHATGALIQCSPESELVDGYTSWGNLDEARLGAELQRRALAGQQAFVEAVLDALGSSDRDDVSFELTAFSSDAQLDGLAATTTGRLLLDRLFDELTSGSVAAEEQVQADRILRSKSRRIAGADFTRGVQHAKIFPYRQAGLTVLDTAPVFASRRAGAVWVRMPTAVLGTDMFRADTATLPGEVFIGGISIPEDEIVGVRLYDDGGRLVYRPALYLVQISNEADTQTAMLAAQAFGTGLTLGTDALLVGAAGRLGQALLWADRIALALGSVTMILREHRGFIISRFGAEGREFVRYVEYVDSALALYGLGRTAIGLVQLVGGLRTAFTQWRTAARNVEEQLSSSEQALVRSLDTNTDGALQQFDDIAAAERARAAPATAPGSGAGSDASAARTATSTEATAARDVEHLRPTGMGLTSDTPEPRAVALYEQIRAATDDVPAVARTMGMSEAVVQRVKDHLFMREHDIPYATGMRRHRFTENLAFAKAWQAAWSGLKNPGIHGTPDWEVHAARLEEQRQFLRDLIVHENVEATLHARGMPVYDPAHPPDASRFGDRGAHANAVIGERAFLARDVAQLTPTQRQAVLRPIMEATVEARGPFTAEELAGMHPEARAIYDQLLSEGRVHR